MARIRDFIDSNGLVCSRHISGFDEIGREITSRFPWLDGGDSANRTMAFYIGVQLVYKHGLNLPMDLSNYVNDEQIFNKYKCLLECKDSPGNFRRHPDRLFWYSHCDRFSRDQAIPLVISFGYMKDRKSLKRFFMAHLKRGLLFMTNTRRNGTTKRNHGKEYKFDTKNQKWLKRNYNKKIPDFTGPEFWGLYIRGFENKWLYPILLISDLQSLVSAIVRRLMGNIDVINHTMISAYSKDVMPTPLSIFTNRFINCPKNLQNKIKLFYYQPTMPFFIADLWAQLCPIYFGKEKKHGLSYLCNWRDIFGFIKRKYILLGSKIFGSKEKINNATYDLRHKTC